jgi:hypothetical protein
MKRTAITLALAATLAGCSELADSTDLACTMIISGCAITSVQDYEYCALAINDPLATPDELRKLCDAFYRGEQCHCITPVCVRDVGRNPMDYDQWTRERINNLHCPAAVLHPYEDAK